MLEQAADFAWIHAHDRPAWGPGRDGPFNLTKFNLLRPARRRHRRQRRLPLDLERRPARGHLAELGRRDPGPAGGLHRLRPRHRRAARDRDRGHAAAPRVSARQAAAALPVPDRRRAGGARARRSGSANAPACHAPGGRVFRPHRADRRDRHRPRAVRHLDPGSTPTPPTPRRWSSASSASRWSRTSATPASRSTASGCARPTCTTARCRRWRRCSCRRRQRPTRFWRGCDIYDPATVGFRSRPPDDDCPRLFALRRRRARQRQRRAPLRHRAAGTRQGGADRVPEDAIGEPP